MKNIFALLVAIFAAAIITFSIISIGHLIVPTPDGIDTNNFDSIKRNFHSYKLRHFLFPLAGHVVGTFAASYSVSRLAATYKLWFSIGIGALFMLASLSLTLRIGHFNWIGIVEIVQYIPTSYLGYKFWQRTNSNGAIVVKS